MRYGINSKPRRRKISRRYPHQYPRIIIGIPAGVKSVDWSRFDKNRVLLLNHEWSQPPIGLISALRYHKKVWSCRLHFHAKTQVSRTCRGYWRYYGGRNMAAGVGGEFNRRTGVFKVYEVSIYTVPSKNY